MSENSFRDRVERFLVTWHYSAADFGMRALRNPNFVLRLRKGISPTLRTVERVETFMKGGAAKHALQHRKPIAKPMSPAQHERRMDWYERRGREKRKANYLLNKARKQDGAAP